MLLQTTAVQPAEQHAPACPTRQNQLQGDLEETVREQIEIKYMKYGTYCATDPVLPLKSNSNLFSVGVVVYAYSIAGTDCKYVPYLLQLGVFIWKAI